MKRLCKFSSAVDLPTRHPSSSRSGKMMIQVMVYLTMLSSLMGIAGLCLHAAFRADEVDQRDSFLLRSLLRCEQQLRDDNRTGSFKVESADKMSLELPEQKRISWGSHRGVLTRRVLTDDKLLSFDRFPFPAGTVVEFAASENRFVLVRINEPSDAVVYAKAADGSTHQSKPDAVAMPPKPDGAALTRSVEIRLRGAL